jgi:hypothetical protein
MKIYPSRINQTLNRQTLSLVVIVVVMAIPFSYAKFTAGDVEYTWGNIHTLQPAAVYIKSQRDLYAATTALYLVLGHNSVQSERTDAYSFVEFEEYGKRIPPPNWLYGLDETALRYSKIYTIEYWGGLGKDELAFLNANYEVASEDKQSRVKAWLKIKTEGN